MIVTKKRVLKIAHLNARLSNKRPQRLFLSYIKCPGVNSSPANNQANRNPEVVVRTCYFAYFVAHVFKYLAEHFVSGRPA